MLRDIFDCHRFTTPLLRRDVKRTTYTARAATVSTHQNLPHDGRTARVRDEKKARDAIAGRAIDRFDRVERGGCYDLEVVDRRSSRSDSGLTRAGRCRPANRYSAGCPYASP